jgi:hypothetical protein|tara:strand:- start:1227 stop:1388 length:162 start_codon:yes stop_codon:yes gene_type:complete
MATPGLKQGPGSFESQQWGILDNGRKPDPARSREGRRSYDRKPLSLGTNKDGT